jgi:acyl dehydratase
MDRIAKLSAQLQTQTCSATQVIELGKAQAMPFERWELGQMLVTKRRTVYEADILQYTQMTGYSAENLFGDRVYLKDIAGHDKLMAPGLLTTSIADALIVGSGVLEGYAVALVGITDLVAKAPVYAGDTIQVHLSVTEVKPSKSKPDRGVVTTQQRVVNQQGREVLTYTVSRMVRRAA